MDRHPVERVIYDRKVIDRVPEQVKTASVNRRLHELLAHRLRGEGFKIAGDLNVSDAIRCFGAKRYIKTAEWKMVEAGLAALGKV